MTAKRKTIRRKSFPFRRGDRVTFKDEKDAKRSGVGVVWSCPAQIGEKRTCKIPGGPIVMEKQVFVTWKFKDKEVLCMDEIKLLKRVN